MNRTRAVFVLAAVALTATLPPWGGSAASTSSASPSPEVTYYGANSAFEITDVALGPDGSTYIVGVTGLAAPFPRDTFVARINASRQTVDFESYVNWTGSTSYARIALGADGRVWVAGQAQGPYLSTSAGAFDSTFGGGYVDIFVVAFNASTGQRLAATYLGGDDYDGIGGLTVSERGNPLVCGATRSSDFPTTSGAFQTTPGDYQDMFVTELNASLDTLVASTRIGVDYNNACAGVAKGPPGHIYLGGHGSPNFPTTPGTFMPDHPGGGSGVIAVLDANLTTIELSTFVGVFPRPGFAFCIDSEMNAYLAGRVDNNSAGSVDPHYEISGRFDVFVTKLNANLTQQIYTRTFGGNSLETAERIAADANGLLYVAGSTFSSGFPLAYAYDSTNESFEGYVTVLSADGSSILYSTLLGGSYQDQANAVVPLPNWGFVAAGEANSLDFPTTANAMMPTWQNSSGFVAWIPFRTPPTAAFNVTPPTGNVTDTFLFDASASFDAIDGPADLQVRWDFDGDDVWDTDWLSLGVVHTNTYFAVGAFTARAEVRNSIGFTAAATREVVVRGVGPTAAISASPQSARGLTAISLDASASIDNASPGWPLLFRWDLDGEGDWDTAWRSEATAATTLSAVGEHTLRVEVQGRYGDTANASTTVTIYDDLPALGANLSPMNGSVLTVFYLDLSASHDWEDPVSALLFRIDWEGDGTFETDWGPAPQFNPGGPLYEHQYPAPGEYNVTVEVEDSAGHVMSAVVMIVVNNTYPVAALHVSPSTGSLTTLFTANASQSFDLESRFTDLRFSYDWDGDGESDTGWLKTPFANTTFNTTGVHHVRVWVVDERGWVNAASATVNVVDGPPLAALAASPQAGNITTPFTLDASGSHDNESAPSGLVFRFDFNGDGVWDVDWSAAPAAEFQLGAPGDYTAAVEVRDEAGFTRRATAQIHVRNELPKAVLLGGFREPGCPSACRTTPTVWLDASNSTDLEDGASGLRYRFDLDGDGTWDTEWSSNPIAEATFGTPGQFTPLVEVRDSNGGATTARFALEPWNVQHSSPPPVSATPPEPNGGVARIDPGSSFGLVLIVALVAGAAVLVALRQRGRRHER